MINLYSAVRS